MARATIKLDTEVAARLRAAKLDLSNDAGRMLTVDGQIEYLLDFWMAHRETPPHPSWLATLETG